jgi:pilus assembly protein Flp/PilA
MFNYLSTMISSLPALKNDTRAVTAVEYGIIAALVATVLVTAVGFLTGGLTATFTSIGHTLGN